MCGISGIISPKPTKFDVTHFNIMGSFNDERGGDSCGIFIDGEIKYGADKDNSLFRNFTYDFKYPKEAQIAISHCRKGSAGYALTINQAQPVVIKSEGGDIDFVLMHNGSISNIHVLKNKYLDNDIDLVGKTDSQILAVIIYKCGYKVLKEYTGTAALCMIDYRTKEPEVRFFRGDSCYNETGAKAERPLYYMVSNGKFYFSSIFISLRCIDNEATIYWVATNKLLILENNELFVEQKINRHNLVKTTVYTGGVYGVGGSSYTPSVSNYVYYNHTDHIYTKEQKPLYGKYKLTAWGCLSETNGTEAWFYKGRLLHSKECFLFLNNLSTAHKVDLDSYTEIIDYFSYLPYWMHGKKYFVNEKFAYVESEIDIDPPFNTNKQYLVDNFVATAKVVIYNFDELRQSILNYIKESEYAAME